MGGGSAFDSALSTRGGRANFVTAEDIASGDSLAKQILGEMKKEGIKFSKKDIVFAAKLENGRKVFLEKNAVEHIVQRHTKQFETTHNIKSAEIPNLLKETISKGQLVKSYRHDSGGKVGYRSVYYYQGQYTVVYGIATNGYINTAFPRPFKGGK